MTEQEKAASPEFMYLPLEDFNPMDQAKGILSFIQAKHPDNGYDVAWIMAELVNYCHPADHAYSIQKSQARLRGSR